MKKNILNITEWVVTFFVSFVILLVVSVSYFQSYYFSKKILNASTISIEVTGAVKYPGRYFFYPGVSVGQVIKKAKQIDSTNLKEIDLAKTIYEPLSIVVPFLETIQVKVSGAIESDQIIFLKSGSRVCFLKKRLKFKKNADLSVLNSLKKLKDGQKIFIPELTGNKLDHKE